jgi:signal transduction histidine kinase
LGLSVSYSIIQNFGGAFYVDSAPGKGSTFTVELPLEIG